ncbi:MAG: hypothetical protein IJT59_04865 [Desulfovibrionaceae bacterium]|nr:hypothetical protein [Desulfovibrionaceae bacterium]
MPNIKIRNWYKLIVISLGLIVFFNIVSPFLFSLSESWQRFIAVQDDTGATSGALYYTDVPITQDAEAHIRSAVKAGMAERQNKH